MSLNRIEVKGCPAHEEYPASAALKPGHLLTLLSTGKVKKHAMPGGWAERLFAKEDALQGKTITDAYAEDDIVPVAVCKPGDVVQARLPANAAAVVIGDPLVSNGDGCLVKSAQIADTVLYANTADSAEHENTTDAADFDKSYTIPANTLQAGDIIKIRGQVTVNDNNSTDTLTLLLQVGNVTIATTGAVDVADGDVGYFEAILVFRAVGASGKYTAQGVQALGVPGTVTAKPFFKEETTTDTTAGIEIAINADWSAAHADNEAELTQLVVERSRSATQLVAVAVEAVDNSAGSSEAFIKARAA